VTIACAGSTLDRLTARSIDSSVSSLGRAIMWTSRPGRAGRAASSRACSITAAADVAVGGRSASAHRPSFSMRMATGS
jgi:hypothetical protein